MLVLTDKSVRTGAGPSELPAFACHVRSLAAALLDGGEEHSGAVRDGLSR